MDIKTQAAINTLIQQRDAALNQVVNLSAELAAVQANLADLSKKLSKREKKSQVAKASDK